MQLARDKSGLLTLFTLTSPWTDVWDGWEGCCFGVLIIKNEAPEYEEVTWEGGPRECTLVADEEGDYFVARDDSGMLCLHSTMPYRNSVTPRWSSPDHCCLLSETKLFNPEFYASQQKPFTADEPIAESYAHLKWEDEPVRVRVVLV